MIAEGSSENVNIITTTCYVKTTANTVLRAMARE